MKKQSKDEQIKNLRKELGKAHLGFTMLINGEIVPLSDILKGVIKGAFVGIDWSLAASEQELEQS